MPHLLRFSRRIAGPHRHEHPQGGLLPDGRYELRGPYGDPTELLMDVPEVVAPAALIGRLRAGLKVHDLRSVVQPEPIDGIGS